MREGRELSKEGEGGEWEGEREYSASWRLPRGQVE